MHNEKRSKPPMSTLVLQLPAALAGWAPVCPGLTVRAGKTAHIRAQDRTFPIQLFRLPPSPGGELGREIMNRLEEAKSPSIVAGSYLGQRLRETLERRGLGYLDSHGHLHLVAPGVLIHVGPAAAPTGGRSSAPAQLGVHGVRAVQALLDVSEPVSVTALANQVGLSLAQTHVVLRTLEQESLVRSEGRGPAKRRFVTDRTQLLDWLVKQPAGRRRERTLDVALYARRPEELWASVTRLLDKAKVPHAVTGAAAASLFGVGPTNVPLSTVRISADVSLAQAAVALGAEPTSRGPNLRLMRDTGRVGSVGAFLHQHVRVGPKVRIYLDSLFEKRGEDIAEQFREVVLGF